MAVGCAKSILISFNLILWLAGGTLIVLGTWIFVDSSKIHLFHFVTSDDLNTDFGYYLAYILLSLGGFVLISGIFGCCGAVRENRCLLAIYFTLLFILTCIELSVSIVTYIYKDHFLLGLEDRLTSGLIKHYGYKNSNEKYLSFSEAVDFAQYKFKCCGIKSDNDYIKSNWRNESNISVEKRNVPLTCCITQDPGEHE
ncbi:tetraspanin-18, putative [Pediculus humanus corporis]|uniref:Tetraspanin n=1 Tax=Pediculus humanus subsp. corporis TaxID=121224 RepID=E0W1X4_PEDHC|nr:tetraspanin-18, putative [Pediculus humanus corporis]EEB19568.1 tetraspanin-18, putative [Pediculus humanus corporis]